MGAIRASCLAQKCDALPGVHLLGDVDRDHDGGPGPNRVVAGLEAGEFG